MGSPAPPSRTGRLGPHHDRPQSLPQVARKLLHRGGRRGRRRNSVADSAFLAEACGCPRSLLSSKPIDREGTRGRNRAVRRHRHRILARTAHRPAVDDSHPRRAWRRALHRRRGCGHGFLRARRPNSARHRAVQRDDPATTGWRRAGRSRGCRGSPGPRPRRRRRTGRAYRPSLDQLAARAHRTPPDSAAAGRPRLRRASPHRVLARPRLRARDRRPRAVDRGMRRLREDLDNGRWQEQHHDLLNLDHWDAGFRLIVAHSG